MLPRLEPGDQPFVAWSLAKRQFLIRVAKLIRKDLEMGADEDVDEILDEADEAWREVLLPEV